MTRRLALVAAFACLAAPAFAQGPPPAVASTRCGGVLCDVYYSGKPLPAPGQPDVPSPTALPCRDFLCAAFGGRTPEPTPVATAPVEPLPAAETKPAKHKRKARKTAAAEAPAAVPGK